MPQKTFPSSPLNLSLPDTHRPSCNHLVLLSLSFVPVSLCVLPLYSLIIRGWEKRTRKGLFSLSLALHSIWSISQTKITHNYGQIGGSWCNTHTQSGKTKDACMKQLGKRERKDCPGTRLKSKKSELWWNEKGFCLSGAAFIPLFLQTMYRRTQRYTHTGWQLLQAVNFKSCNQSYRLDASRSHSTCLFLQKLLISHSIISRIKNKCIHMIHSCCHKGSGCFSYDFNMRCSVSTAPSSLFFPSLFFSNRSSVRVFAWTFYMYLFTICSKLFSNVEKQERKREIVICKRIAFLFFRYSGRQNLFFLWNAFERHDDEKWR